MVYVSTLIAKAAQICQVIIFSRMFIDFAGDFVKVFTF